MSADVATGREPGVQRLLEQAMAEQKSSWQRGERVPVEEFLGRSPCLRDDEGAVLDLIYQEFVLRKESGEAPDPGEFTGRFPDLADSILLQLGLDAAMLTTYKLPDNRGWPSPAEPAPPRIIGDCEVLETLGHGGMGVVYKAHHPRLGRDVAIKMMLEGRYADPEHRDRFVSEARAAARLRHPNIIAIDAVGEYEERPYLLLELVGGGSLAQRLAEKPMAPRDAAELLETLARAVHAAHEAGVVHRDLKPSNILFTTDGVPKVSDFGLAKLLDSESGRTLTGQVVGTPNYMAPEQAEGHSKRVGPAADVYALGAILYHALTGRPPFLGESALETLKLVTYTDAVPPRRLRPDVPRDLETICLKCLEKLTSKRYATALELADDLRRFQGGEPILARRIGVFRRGAKWSKRHPWQSASAAIAALAVASVVGLTYRHNLQLRDQIGLTEAKSAEARRNYQEARSTIEAMLARLKDRRFAETPRMKELALDQMSDALSFYQRTLGQNKSNDPAVRADTARAFGVLSRVQQELGRSDQAESLVRQALDLIAGLRAEQPDNLDYLRLQLDNFGRLAVYLGALGRGDEALAASADSLGLAVLLATASPDDPSDQDRVASCEDNYASRLLALKRRSGALQHYENGRGNLGNADSRRLLGQATQHQANHRHLNHGLTGFVPVLVVLAQTAATRQPGKGTFHHPTFRQELESLDIIISFDDFQNPLTEGANPTDQLSRIAAVGPHSLQPRPRSQEFGLGEDQFGAITVLDVRWVNHHGQ